MSLINLVQFIIDFMRVCMCVCNEINNEHNVNIFCDRHYKIYNSYNDITEMITKNVNRCWTSSLFLGLNFEDFDISSGTGSVILVFENKCAACITGCSTYAGIGFLGFRRIFLDSIDL